MTLIFFTLVSLAAEVCAYVPNYLWGFISKLLTRGKKIGLVGCYFEGSDDQVHLGSFINLMGVFVR